MDEDQPKKNEEASTSKVNEPKSNRHSRDNFSDEGRGFDEHSNDSWVSDSYDRSIQDIPEDRLETTQPVAGKAKAPRRNRKPLRRHGRRVEKRRRSHHKRVVRREAKRQTKPTEKRAREASVCTIFTRLSSKNSHVAVCKFCGHRTCRRLKYGQRWKNQRRKLKGKGVGKVKERKKTSECIQVGSRSLFLSPLLIGDTPPDLIQPFEDNLNDFVEITPEMIHQVLRRSTMWRHGVTTDVILTNLKNSYPVNPNHEELLEELSEKLEIALMIGIVASVGDEVWRLSSHLERRNISSNHVSLFWKLYRDTMRPIAAAKTIPLQRKRREQTS